MPKAIFTAYSPQLVKLLGIVLPVFALTACCPSRAELELLSDADLIGHAGALCPDARKVLVERHTESAPPAIQAAIRNRRPVEGMTTAQLVAAMGRPSETTQSSIRGKAANSRRSRARRTSLKSPAETLSQIWLRSA